MTVTVIHTRKDFDDAMESSKTKLVVIDFFAEWCGPCKLIAPKISQLSEDYNNSEFYKLDVDVHQEIAAELKIRAMPTFIFFRDGKPIGDPVVGANLSSIVAGVKEYSV